MAELSSLRQELHKEKERGNFLNDSCKKYLQAYEQVKKKLDLISMENERLTTRLSDLKEISMAKEANYEMITHIESLDQSYFQETIEKLQHENQLLREENKLLNEVSSSEFKSDKKNVLSLIKKRQQQIISENNYLASQNEYLHKELQKNLVEVDDVNARYKELMAKQLEQAKALVAKDEEIRFWKCSLTEILCGEVLKNYTKEAEFSTLINSTFDFHEKYLRIKDKLVKIMKAQQPQIIASESNIMISNNSFIVACVSMKHLLLSLADTLFESSSRVHLSVFVDLSEKREISARNAEELMESYESESSGSLQTLVQVGDEQSLWILDIHNSPDVVRNVLQVIYSPETLTNTVRQGLLNSEAIYLLLE